MPEPKQGPASAAPAAETLAAILAEMREYFDLLKRGLIPDNVARMTTRQRHQFWADRIEAAAKREREAAQYSRDARDAMDYAATAARQAFVGVDLANNKPTHTCVEIAPGNAAAMREALDGFLYWAKRMDEKGCSMRQFVDFVREKTESALSAPARNCDVGTADGLPLRRPEGEPRGMSNAQRAAKPRHVWLWGRDAVHEIEEYKSAFCVEVFATKRAMLNAWKALGNLEMLDDEERYTRDPNTVYAVWHKKNGENVLQAGHRALVQTAEDPAQ